MTLKTQTLLKKILALRDLQLLYQTLLLKRQLLKRGGRLLLVRRLQQMRLLDHVQLQLFLQLLYRLLQLLPAQLGELVLMLQIFRFRNCREFARPNSLGIGIRKRDNSDTILGKLRDFSFPKFAREGEGEGQKKKTERMEKLHILTLLNKSETRIIRRARQEEDNRGQLMGSQKTNNETQRLMAMLNCLPHPLQSSSPFFPKPGGYFKTNPPK